MNERISRRKFFRWSAAGLGVTALSRLLPATAVAAVPQEPTAGDAETTEAASQRRSPAQVSPSDHRLERLIAPIAVGTVLGTARVEELCVDHRGVGVVKLADGHGRTWNAEICKRAASDATLRPLAVTDGYSVFLRNNGNGRLPTDERVGRAVLALADRVRKNERDLGILPLRSRKQLWHATGYTG